MILAFYQNVVEQLDTIEECLSKRRVIPCLSLLYSTIDVFASLERMPGEGRIAFLRWVDNNMLKVHPLPCTALELYAARCGVLHTLTAESDLSRQGKVRPILYAWGSATTADLDEASRRLNRVEVAVHVRDLVSSFREGLAMYLEELMQNPDRMRAVRKKVDLWFTQMKQEAIADFVAVSAASTKTEAAS